MIGIDRSYTRWTWHGEKDDLFITSNQSDYEDYVDDTTEGDRLEDMTDVIKEHFVGKTEVFDELLSDAETPLYEKCTDFTRLSAVLKLYNLKAGHGWSNKSFTALLELLKDMLPKDNVLPDRTYEARKMLRAMRVDYERIHACRNDCVLYRNEYENHQKCPNSDCGEPRFKREGVPSKVVWYFPILPRIKRLFSNAEDAKNLRWHSDEKIYDGKLRHPADSPQWKMIDNLYPDFGSEARNLRLALATDGMNPYGNLSSIHSTWHVVLMRAFEIPLLRTKWILRTAADRFREFKCRLGRDFMYSSDKEVCNEPPDVYEFIGQDTWIEFINQRLSDNFQELSKKNRGIAKRNKYPYRGFRKGYVGIEEEIKQERNLDPSTEIPRCELWKRARVDIDGNIHTTSVKQVADKIASLC